MADLALTNDIQTAIGSNIDPVELVQVYLPRMEYALEKAQTSQETNEIRAQIETVNTYLKHALPKAVKDRKQQFAFTQESEMLYLRASAKAGSLSKNHPDKRTQADNQYASESFQKLGWQEFGYKHARDMVTCERICELDDEDWRTYDEVTLSEMKQPTIHGAERLWKKLYFEPEETILPDGKYRVIYVDPPWKYGDEKMGLSSFGPAEEFYPTLSVKELCALKVGDLAHDDAVLFLWVTSPFLMDAAEIIKAWGFEYKASFVWDKGKHNFGHYNSVRHELLLICTRGSCLPDNSELFDSVQTIERSNEHSEKPEEFRKIIDSLYTSGPRIELFARKEVDGWDVWGNEVNNGTVS